MFLVYPLGIILLVIFTAISYIFAPWIAKQADEHGNLPPSLIWFQTFDATLDANGTGYDARVAWLRRNPGYGFAYYVLGMDYFAFEWTPHYHKFSGGSELFFATTPDGAFNFTYHLQFSWGHLWGKFGWKAWNRYDKATNTMINQPWGPQYTLPMCFTPISYRRHE